MGGYMEDMFIAAAGLAAGCLVEFAMAAGAGSWQSMGVDAGAGFFAAELTRAGLREPMGT
jgi:hypothetical protein